MADRVVKVSIFAQAQQYLSTMEQVSAKTRATAKDADKLKASTDAQAAAFKKAGTIYLAAGGVLAAGLALAVKKAADFDAQMAQVKTLSGATAGEMGKLRDAALKMGQGIGLSATQVADAETELVKAGVSVKDQMGGALKGTLDLAAAGQMNVADATQIAASAMTQFKLSGKDVPHIADLLAAGADKALGSVSDLGQGLKYVGPVAQSMGISIDQTVGTLSLLAQNGILADQAGTSLRGMLLSLTSPSALAQKSMEKYGITLYDSSGKFIGLNGAADQLKDHLGGLDQATRNQALGQIFGNEQITTATVLMQGGASAVDDWTKKVNDSGFAAKQAAGKMDSLNGDLSKLSAAWDSALINIGESGQTPLRGVTQSITGVINAFNGMPEAGKTAVFWAGAVGSAVTVAGGAFLLGVPKVAAYRAALETLGPAAQGTAGAISTVGKVAGAAAAGVGIGLVGYDLLKKAFDSLGPSAGEMSNKVASATSAVDFFQAALSKTANGAQLAPKLVDSLADAMDSLAGKGHTGGLQLTSTMNALGDIGDTLTLLSSTDMPHAQAQFKLLADSAGLTTAQTSKMLDQMPSFKAALTDQATHLGMSADKSTLLKLALGELGDGADSSASSTDGATDSVTELGQQASLSKDELSGLADQLRGMGDATLSARDAARQYQSAIDDATASAQKNGKTLDIGTEKGRENQAAIDNVAKSVSAYAAAVLEQTGDQSKANAVISAGRAQLIKVLGQFGITGKAAQAYADKLGLIPSVKQTKVDLNTVAAEAALRNLLADKTLTVWVRTVAGQTTTGGGAGRNVGHATGGYISGPGTGTSDSILARLSNGEFVVKASQTRKHLGLLNAINDDTIPAFATGGVVGAQKKLRDLQAKQRAAQATYDAANSKYKKSKTSKNKTALDKAKDKLDDAKSDVRDANADFNQAHSSLADTRYDFSKQVRRGLATQEDPYSLVDQLLDIGAGIGGKKGQSYRDSAYKSEKSLIALNKAQDANTAKLDKAKTVLEKVTDTWNDLKDKASQMASSVSSAIRGIFNVNDLGASTTRTVQDAPQKIGDFTVQTSHQETVAASASSIDASIKADAAAAKGFADKLAKLKSKGLNPALLAEIAGAGVENGGPIADALLKATSGQISSINANYVAVGKYSDLGGQTVADANFKTQIDLAQKQVVKAQANVDATTAAGKKITDQMQTETKKLVSGIAGALSYGTSVKKAGGGSVYGPGTGTSDSIRALLSNGEIVMQTSVASKYRRDLEYMNRTGLNPFARIIYAERTVYRGGSSSSTAPQHGDVNLTVMNPSVKDVIQDTKDAAALLRTSGLV